MNLVTDDSKEHRFNSVIKYLRESNFTIPEEKHIIVTSEFYAKIFSSEKSSPAIELKSYPSLGNGIIFQIRPVILKGQFPNLSIADLKNRIEQDIELNELLTKNETLLSNNDGDLLVQKIYFIDPQKTESKFEVLNIVSVLQKVTKNIEESLQRLQPNK
jgi:hypothetical protein